MQYKWAQQHASRCPWQMKKRKCIDKKRISLAVATNLRGK